VRFVNRPDAKSERGWVWWLAALVATAAVLAVGYYVVEPLLRPELASDAELLQAGPQLEEARLALRQEDYQSALLIARRILLEEDPLDVEALLVAGESAMKLGDAASALRFYGSIPQSATAAYVTACWSAAYIHLYQGELRLAEQLFREALQIDPTNVGANQGLGFVLGVEGRRWESVPFLLEPIRQSSIAMEPLILLATIDTRSIESGEVLDAAKEADPSYRVPLIGTALSQLYRKEVDEAETTVRKVLQSAPDQVEAHALLGRILMARDQLPEQVYRQWLADLPTAATEHPAVWFVQGVQSQKEGDLRAAARCYWEAIRIHPNFQKANYRLSSVLRSLRMPEQAKVFAERARMLQQLLNLLYPLFNEREAYPDVQQMIQAAELCHDLGRYWESWAWYSLVLEVDPAQEVAKQQAQRLQGLTADNPPLVVPEANPTNQVDLSDWPLPKTLSTAGDSDDSTAGDSAGLRFEDLASECGIEFVFENGDDPDDPGMLLCQELGGAMAILDYDLDRWPDIYVAQGGPWPRQPDQTQFQDRLFRNLGNGQFQDVTEQANLGDNRYSQGAAIGDIDNDGWPDIFVANLGVNRIYRNQGDGTFADVTTLAGFAGDRWSTSAAIADLNADSLPDIYVVNYLEGQQALTMICYEGGQPRACAPHEFPPAQDRLFVNQGDGRFREATKDSGLFGQRGNGLGVLVSDLHGQGSLSIYVANDMTPNFLFVNESAGRDGALHLVDRAVLEGAAYGADGQVQASMGIATGDADEDGRIDLLCAHYYDETNTFYRRIADDFFDDATQQFGLREPSIKVLSFGAQFLDFENDGFLDLVLACGHVDDFRHVGKPYMMKPQAYANRQGTHFELLDPEAIGDYFAGEYLGRSLALIDWNRDGKQDFALLHLYVPSALLTNRTQRVGHYLQLHLRGTTGDRDAVGTTVTAELGQRQLVRQLTAGDGFQCSSEKKLHFGLGDVTKVDRLIVKWPRGTTQEFRDVPVDRELFVLENQDAPLNVPRD
jgi:tetratricopeptide (TPR) repeat protein